MITRTLTPLGDRSALILDSFIMDYFSLSRDSEISISIENDKLIISRASKSEAISYCTPSDKSDILSDLKSTFSIAPINDAKSKKNYNIKSFFDDGRLKIGDKVFYHQAIAEGKTDINDKAIIAEVIDDANHARKYLKSLGDGQVYSFSGLRTKLIKDFGISNVHADWGHTLTEEWRALDSNKKLSQL